MSMALPDQFRELLKYRCHVDAVFCVRERHTIRQIQQGMVFHNQGGRFAGHQEPVLFQQVNPRLVHEMAEIAADGQSSRGQDTGGCHCSKYPRKADNPVPWAAHRPDRR